MQCNVLYYTMQCHVFYAFFHLSYNAEVHLLPRSNGLINCSLYKIVSIRTVQGGVQNVVVFVVVTSKISLITSYSFTKIKL